MQFTIDRDELLTAFTRVRDAIAVKDIVPILKTVFLQANKAGLVLRTSNLDLLLEAHVECDTVKATGQVCLPGKRVIEILERLPEGLIQLKASGSKVVFKAKRSTYQSVVSDSELFPTFPKTPPVTGEFDADFLPYLAKVKVSMTDNLTRLNMRCVHVHGTRKTLSLTATNSFTINTYVGVPYAFKGVSLWPDNFVDALLKLRPDNFEFGQDENFIGVVAEKDGMQMRMMHRKWAPDFPDARSILSRFVKPKCKVIVDAEQFLAVCKRVAISSPGVEVASQMVTTTQIVDFTFSPGGKATAQAEDKLGKMQDVFKFKGSLRQPIVLKVSPKFLLEYLDTTVGDDVSIEFFGNDAPIALHEDTEHRFLVNVSSVKIG